MDWGSVLFTTFAGLRGAVSLILAQELVLDQSTKAANRRVTAEVPPPPLLSGSVLSKP